MVVKDVDPRYPDVYEKSWELGVSHGKFTATPDQVGITYIFGHATSDKANAANENAWFSNLDQLVIGDQIILYYQGKKYYYEVNQIRFVSPTATGYYTGVSPVSMVRLQFCGPPTGSLASRTLIDAVLVNTQTL
jgi:LPXTG-site transpeptidase (sortase) family protein